MLAVSVLAPNSAAEKFSTPSVSPSWKVLIETLLTVSLAAKLTADLI